MMPPGAICSSAARKQIGRTLAVHSQRIAKLAGHLLQHPGNVPRYVTHNLITRREPVELELPWFSYAAIDFLKSYLGNEMQVFEFGSGGSTLFFAQHCKSVASVQANAA